MIAYLNGRFLPKEDISISPDDRGFLFSDGLYEVIRSYDGRLFRTREHLLRLSHGARALRFNRAVFSDLEAVAVKLIQTNEMTTGDALVYIQVTRGVAPRSHAFPPSDTPLTVYAFSMPFKSHTEEMQNGINVVLLPDQRWARCDVKSVSLLANTLAHQRARDNGASEAVFVRDGALTEGTHSNVMAVFGGTVLTPPKNNYILGGITRQAVLELCKELNLPSDEAPIYEYNLHEADELMMVGTTVEITPVVKIDGTPLATGEPGPITRKLQAAFRNLVTS